MSKIVRLTESDLTRIVRRVISEQNAQLLNKVTQDSMRLGFTINTSADGPGLVELSRRGKVYIFNCSGRMVRSDWNNTWAAIDEDAKSSIVQLAKDACPALGI
jgi:hypothetical protein